MLMNCGVYVDTPRSPESEPPVDTLDIELRLLSGVAYHLWCLSYADIIHEVIEKAEALMESGGRVKGDLDPSECYELGLTLDGSRLRDDVTLREAGLQTGDTVWVVCKKGDRRRRANSRLVDAVFKKDFTRVVAIQAELQLIQEQQDIEKDPVFATKKTLVVDLVLLLQEAMEKRDFARMNQIQVALRFILEQHDTRKDQRGAAKQACEAELKQLLDQLPSWAVAVLYGPWAIM